jgi:hypothetical protein
MPLLHTGSWKEAINRPTAAALIPDIAPHARVSFCGIPKGQGGEQQQKARQKNSNERQDRPRPTADAT